MLLFFQQLNYLVEQRALAFLATRVFLYRFAFSYKQTKKKSVCVVLTYRSHRFVLRDQFGGLALLNSSGFLIQGGVALGKSRPYFANTEVNNSLEAIW